MKDQRASTRPRVLAILPGFTASTLLDIVDPMLHLEKSGKIRLEVALEFYTSLSALEKSDLVLFCRNTDPRYTHILEAIHQRRIPYIYDLDDNLFEIPLDTPLGQYHRAPEQAAFLAHYIEGASLVRVYSLPLLDRVKPLNLHVEKVVAPLDWSLISPDPVPQKAGPIKIVYVTSRKLDSLSNIFLPAINQILDQYGERVEMHFLGYLPPSIKDRPNVYSVGFRTNYREFLRDFSRSGYDIGLAPLLDDVFHRSKTNNKFREYAACAITGIYSNVDVYSDCVTNGETGLLVENTTGAWYEALRLLIENASLRSRIGLAARAYARQHYSKDQFCQIWNQHIEMVLINHKLEKAEAPGTINRSKVDLSGQNGWWMHKVRQTWKKIKSTSPQEMMQAISMQVRNLWFLYKINRFKRF